MRSLYACALLAALCSEAIAFAPPRATTSSDASVLFANMSPEKIKSVGGGIPSEPAGSRRLFDPATAGMLKGTGAADARIAQAYQFQYLSPLTSPVVPDVLDEAQHWLEEIGTPPAVFAKASKPAQAQVLGRTRIITESAPGDIQHVLLKLPVGMQYIEGQSLSVIPPGSNPKTGKPHKPRLYSIASTRYGDALNGNTVSLCVRRALYEDPVTGLEDPTKAGVCSNFLCDSTPGTIVNVAGPVGKTMLLPQDAGDPDWVKKDLIMVATGTGIAPFRGFMRRLFLENTVARHMYQGTAWLVLGVPTTGSLLYADEWNEILWNQQQKEEKELETSSAFRANFAISREMQNAEGGKLYVQDVLAHHADELFHKLLNEGAVMYFCGLKGMMPGILESLVRIDRTRNRRHYGCKATHFHLCFSSQQETVATQRGLVWGAVLSSLKKNGQWHVEVY
jgi:ferredoxin--NADP+ reductase